MKGAIKIVSLNLAIPILLAALLLSCASTPRDKGKNEVALKSECDALFLKAQEALDLGHFSEAIHSYVSVLAIARGREDGALDEAAAQAESRLSAIGASLSIEATPEWLDARGNQLSGDSARPSSPGSPSPAVYLSINYGSAKAPVADAPIRFAFTSNGGSLLPLASTDAYGRANTSVASIDRGEEEAVIRAYPEFSSRGYTFAFPSVFRDFIYLPSASTAALALLVDCEEAGLPLSNRESLDLLSSALAPLGLDFLPLDEESFNEPIRRALAGDSRSAGELCALASPGSRPAAYLFVLGLSLSKASQLEYGGKKLNIFSAKAAISLRILRSDGGQVYALPPLRLEDGQGGTAEKAIRDALAKANAALALEIPKRLGEIGSALGGGPIAGGRGRPLISK